MEIIDCPELSCRQPAEIISRWVLESTDGPIEHVMTRCLARHVFTPHTEMLARRESRVPRQRHRTG
jgi:hypothetical protein